MPAVAALAALLALPGFAQTTKAPQFTISTVAGTGLTGFSGDGGQATSASLDHPFSVASDAAGNVYVSEEGNQRIRKISLDGKITTIVGTGVQGFGGDGGPAVNARISNPAISVDAVGNLYIGDVGNNRIRKVTNGIITTIAGRGAQGFDGDGGPALNAAINTPQDLIVDNEGAVYFTDTRNQRIRKIANGIITTVAGNGTAGYSGDGGPAVNASLLNPCGVAVDKAGTLFIADRDNHRVRKVAGGIITTVAGTGTAGFSGDGGPAINARLNAPAMMRFDAVGNLYIPELGNSRVRVMLTDGTLWTAAGNGIVGYNGDGVLATKASLYNPQGVAPDTSGRIYISDFFNHRIRLLTPLSQAPSITQGGVVSASAFGGFTSISPGSWIEIFGSDLAANTRGWAGADFNGINAPTSLDGTTVTIGGKPAFVDFISPGQVNALVPSDTPIGTQQMAVKTGIGTSAAYNITVNALQPGLLAPSSFKINGVQYAVAILPDGAYALPVGAISGVASRPAKPGETIVLYGIGFGPVTPTIPAGQLVQQVNALASSLQMSIGGIPALASYAGLAPSFTGLYQFNVTVPSAAAGNAPLIFTLNGVSGTQTLFIAVGN